MDMDWGLPKSIASGLPSGNLEKMVMQNGWQYTLRFDNTGMTNRPAWEVYLFDLPDGNTLHRKLVAQWQLTTATVQHLLGLHPALEIGDAEIEDKPESHDDFQYYLQKLCQFPVKLYYTPLKRHQQQMYYLGVAGGLLTPEYFAYVREYYALKGLGTSVSLSGYGPNPAYGVQRVAPYFDNLQGTKVVYSIPELDACEAAYLVYMEQAKMESHPEYQFMEMEL